MKRKITFSTVILILVLIVCFIYRTDITNFVMKNIVQYTKVESPKYNSYSTNYDFEFVKDTDNFHVKNRQDILNVIYTFLNSGQSEFTFYCDIKYDECANDLQDISKNSELLSVINNLVSPYNSYEKLYITTNSYGMASIKISKLYSNEDIKRLNSKVDDIENAIIDSSMTDREKIKAVHDYIINNTIYDEERADQIEKGNDQTYQYNSHKATGPLLEGWGLCSGYSDAMKIFLDRFGIPNYKIANTNHIWNLVYIDNEWRHLDLTWDDPVTSDHSNMLLDKFFLVDTDTVLKLDKTNHNFNKNYYPELNK